MSLLPERFYLDNIFDDFFVEPKSNAMKCDIYEKDGKFNLEIDIPGFKKEDINIECNDGYLTVTASKEEKMDEEGKNYIHKERTYGKVQRRFYVGDVEMDEIKANFNDGILKITVPKEQKKTTNKQIVIE